MHLRYNIFFFVFDTSQIIHRYQFMIASIVKLGVPEVHEHVSP